RTSSSPGQGGGGGGVPPRPGGGAPAAIGETSYQLGAGMGIALLGSVMNAAYAPGLTGVPGVPAEASDAAANSLGEAYQVADRLGGAAGAALHTAARHAFVDGLHLTLFVSAGLLLAGAVMAVRLPRVMECPVDVEAAVEEAAAEAAAEAQAAEAARAAGGPAKEPVAPAAGERDGCAGPTMVPGQPVASPGDAGTAAAPRPLPGSGPAGTMSGAAGRVR
ncbi:hypothetical protein ACFV5C_29870, partial [Streptomyces sp. NPDC059762]